MHYLRCRLKLDFISAYVLLAEDSPKQEHHCSCFTSRSHLSVNVRETHRVCKLSATPDLCCGIVVSCLPFSNVALTCLAHSDLATAQETGLIQTLLPHGNGMFVCTGVHCSITCTVRRYTCSLHILCVQDRGPSRSAHSGDSDAWEVSGVAQMQVYLHGIEQPALQAALKGTPLWGRIALRHNLEVSLARARPFRSKAVAYGSRHNTS